MDYCSPAGNNLIEEWYSDLPDEAQAEFDVTLKVLSITEDWRELSEFDNLGREGLCEIRFKANKVRTDQQVFSALVLDVFQSTLAARKKARFTTHRMRSIWHKAQRESTARGGNFT